MEQGRQCGQFNFSRSRGAAFDPSEESVNSRQQTLLLFAFRGLLFAEFIPLGRVHVLRAKVAR